jgi:hypothetical protein
MKTPTLQTVKRRTGRRHGLGGRLLLLCASALIMPPSRAPGVQTPQAFVVAGARFHQRHPEDAGEVRLCLQNTGVNSLTRAQLQIRVRAEKTTDAATQSTECPWVYAKLSPPVLRREQYGEVVVKLQEPPPGDSRLTCDVSVADGTTAATVSVDKPTLWISYVGFSADLREVCVYLENAGAEPAAARWLSAGTFDLAGRTRAVHVPVPPGDKGCLIADLPAPLTTGEFLRVVLAADSGGKPSKLYTVVRAVHAFPLLMEFGGADPHLGLDEQRPFLQTMACPAHAHGSPEAAAAKFLDDYAQRFLDDPGQAVQIAICRSGLPQAWFRFAALPDVALMNPCLRPPPARDPAAPESLCPFFHTGELAKQATEPGRYVAIIPIGPGRDDESFLLQGLSPQEARFLVYAAVASGAKGVVYRDQPVEEPLTRDAFRQLNQELQHLKPLLLLAEPVAWATTTAEDHVARVLLCGDQAAVVMVLDTRYFSRQRNGRLYTPPFGRAVVSVPVRVRIPPGVDVREVRTPFAALAPGRWKHHSGTLDLTVEMTESAQVYIVSLQEEAKPREGGPVP